MDDLPNDDQWTLLSRIEQLEKQNERIEATLERLQNQIQNAFNLIGNR